MKRRAETGGRNGSQNLNWCLRVSSALKGPVREGCVQAPRSGPERRRCHWELHTGKVCNLPCNTVAWGGTQLRLAGWILYYTVCSSMERHWLVLQLLSCLAFSWWEKSKKLHLVKWSKSHIFKHSEMRGAHIFKCISLSFTVSSSDFVKHISHNINTSYMYSRV